MRLAVLVASLLALPAIAAPHVMDAWVRALPASAPTSAAFLTLHNPDKTANALVAASSSAAGRIELHRHELRDGVVQMRQLSEIALPAGEQVTLAPGGLHLMLLDLKQPLVAGQSIDLTLKFADGSEQELRAPITKASRYHSVAADEHHHHHQDAADEDHHHHH